MTNVIPLRRSVAAAASPAVGTAAIDAGRGRWPMVALLLLVAAFACRCWQFGNPLIQVDENFYLLVGDRMLRGELPYVDIWDRKPIGLFLLFAGIRLLGGEGIVQYQVVATLFVAGTALLVARMAARIATLPAAVAAAIFYILLLVVADGSGGQAPVFYNVFVAGAAWATLVAWRDAAGDPPRIRRLGVAAMALAGIGIQIKYTVVFEGVFFGLALMLAAWRARPSLAALIPTALLWIAVALLPTLLAILYYAWAGALDAFLYANFFSIGARDAADGAELLRRLGKIGIALAVPAAGVLLSVLLKPWRSFPDGPGSFGFVMAWLGAALFGFFVFGTYFDHYALPLLVPMAIACAPLFAYRPHRIGLVAAIAMLLAGAIADVALIRSNQRKRGGAPAMAALLAAIRPRMAHGLFLYDSDSILYYFTNARIPTRFAFPQHLNLQREAHALGVDVPSEVRRILATRPGLILDCRDRDESEENADANRIVRAELARHYRLAVRVPQGKRIDLVYERLPGV